MLKNKPKDKLREKIAELVTPAWPLSGLLTADKILSLFSRELLRRLPKENKPKLGSKNFEVSEAYVNGFNQALSEVKKVIKSLGE